MGCIGWLVKAGFSSFFGFVALLILWGCWVLLGITPPWLWGLFVLGVGVMIYLKRYRRARYGYKRLMFGVVLLGTIVLTIARVMLTPPPYIPPNTHPATLELGMGGLPFLSDFYDFESPTQVRGVVFVPIDEDTISIDVFFEERYDLFAGWGMSQIAVTVRCPQSTPNCRAPLGTYTPPDLPANLERASVTPVTATPEINVRLPLSREHIHQTFELVAEAQLLTLDNNSQPLSIPISRTLTLFVGAPEELQTRLQLNRWNKLKGVLRGDPGIGTVVIFGLVGMASTLWGIFAVGRTPQMLERGASSLQKQKSKPVLKDLPLGLMLAPIDANHFALSPQAPLEGVEVYEVLYNGVWNWQAGDIQVGDVIIVVEQRPIIQPSDVYDALPQTPQPITVRLYRRGQYHTSTVMPYTAD